MTRILNGQFYLLSLLAFATQVIGQASDVNVTDIKNWPTCAQNCIPIGLGPPVNCGSLSNLNCICLNPAFTLSIADCEQSTCTPDEAREIGRLSVLLCAPVGGLGAAVSSAVETYFSTRAAATPTTPVLEPTPTAIPGNASDLSTYPLCAQFCNNQSVPLATGDVTDINYLCGPEFRGLTAACQKRTCNRDDYNTTAQLAAKLCGPLYSGNAALSASVGSAIASATKTATSAGVTSSPNATITVLPNTPSPSAFTGGVGSLVESSIGLGVMAVVGLLGVVVLGL